jgi:hypothetical protein
MGKVDKTCNCYYGIKICRIKAIKKLDYQDKQEKKANIMEIPFQVNGRPSIQRDISKFHKEFSIGKGQLYNIGVHTVPIRIHCLEGVLWVTSENDPEDYLLQRCQSTIFYHGGLIVIQALAAGKFRITSE